MRVGCPDLDGCDVSVVVGYLAVRSCRYASIDIDQTTKPSYVGLDCRPVESLGAVVDMYMVGSDRWFLDKKDI